MVTLLRQNWSFGNGADDFNFSMCDLRAFVAVLCFCADHHLAGHYVNDTLPAIQLRIL